MIHCLLSLDLSNADDQQRRDFNKELDEDYGWKKLSGVDTVWAQAFNYQYDGKKSVDMVAGLIDTQLISVAKSQSIASLRYVVQIANSDVVASKITKGRLAYDYFSTPYNPY